MSRNGDPQGWIRARILDKLARREKMGYTRRELAMVLGEKPTSISSVVWNMLCDGVIKEDGRRTDGFTGITVRVLKLRTISGEIHAEEGKAGKREPVQGGGEKRGEVGGA